MELCNMLAVGWYKIILLIGLAGVIIFYAMYRRSQS